MLHFVFYRADTLVNEQHIFLSFFFRTTGVVLDFLRVPNREIGESYGVGKRCRNSQLGKSTRQSAAKRKREKREL